MALQKITKSDDLTELIAVENVDYVLGIDDSQTDLSKKTVKIQIPNLKKGDITDVDTIAALRLQEGSEDGAIMHVQGYYALGDVGDIPNYYWDSTSSATDNGGSIIKPTPISGAGRWLWTGLTLVNVQWFGALGESGEDYTTILNYLTANFDNLYLPDGEYGLSDTWVIGNNKRIIGCNYNNCTIEQLVTFPTTDRKAMIALNENYDDAFHDDYEIDSSYIENLTILGRATLGTDNYPSTLTGVSGLDVTWTKDDIVLRDVFFQQLNRGLTKRDSDKSDVVHWGIKVQRGGANFCYRAYEMFPSLGSIDNVDIQTCNQGIWQTSSNATSSVVWIKDVRVENNINHTLPDTDGEHVHVESRAEITGYFEGGIRHVVAEGANNLHVTIGACTISKAFTDAAQTTLGVPVLYAGTGVLSSLTLENVQGLIRGNIVADRKHAAFMEFIADPKGTLNWQGMGSNGPEIFKWTSPAVSRTYPPLDIMYTNNQAQRGFINNNDVLEYQSTQKWSGNENGFYQRKYVKRINKNAGAGVYDVITFTDQCAGTLRVALIDPSTPKKYSLQVWEFYTQNDGTVVAYSIADSSPTEPVYSFTSNKLVVTTSSTFFTTTLLMLDVGSDKELDDILTFN